MIFFRTLKSVEAKLLSIQEKKRLVKVLQVSDIKKILDECDADLDKAVKLFNVCTLSFYHLFAYQMNF